MKLVTVHYLGFTAMDRRFSNPMLPWIVSEIRKRDCYERVSLGMEDGFLQAYNSDFELQFSHNSQNMSRFSQADIDPCTFLYLVKEDAEQLLYCYLFQALKPSDFANWCISSSNNSRATMWFAKVWCLLAVAAAVAGKYWKPTVYQKIRQSPKLTQFFSLLESNRPAKLNLQYGEMTVFVPTNEAFEWYSGRNLNELINYHMVWYAKQLKDLESGFLATVIEENPPVWVTKLDDDIFINNARIIPEYSDYVSEINNLPKKPQVLHVIDEVLDPVARRSSLALYNPSASDFLSRSQFWDLGDHKIDMFYRKVLSYRKENLFKSEGSFTFFVPVNEGFTDYRQQMFDGNVIDGHVIPNRVLFTRPCPKDTPFETLANGDYLYVVVLLSGSEGKLFAKSHTLVGDSNHPAGEIVVEIVKPNIPVKNGVVHLIKRPLVVFDRRLTLFPYLPITDKIAMDPNLDFSFSLGERTKFNMLLKDEKLKFTYFIPRNKAWDTLQYFLEVNSTYFDDVIVKYGRSILSRHVLVSNVSYTIEDLRQKSNLTDTADVDLPTLGGILKVGIGELDDKYVIYWRNKFIPIHRANYMCTNGIIHIVDDVFMNEEDLERQDTQAHSSTNPLKLLNMLIQVTL